MTQYLYTTIDQTAGKIVNLQANDTVIVTQNGGAVWAGGGFAASSGATGIKIEILGLVASVRTVREQRVKRDHWRYRHSFHAGGRATDFHWP